MSLYFHPENKPWRFWEIKSVGPGKSAIPYWSDSVNSEYGIYRRRMILKGNEGIGGHVTIEQGWLGQDTTERSVDSLNIKSLSMGKRRRIHHFVSEIPTVAVSAVGLILDSIIKLD